MIRVLWFAFLFAVVAGFVTGWNSTVAAVVFVGTIAVVLFALATNRVRLKCPYCYKRVKLGASVCHHCGRQVAEPRPLLGGHAEEPTSRRAEDVLRSCPHCANAIWPASSFCPVCHQPVVPWRLDGGSWWDRDGEGRWMRLDQRSGGWVYDSPPAG